MEFSKVIGHRVFIKKLIVVFCTEKIGDNVKKETFTIASEKIKSLGLTPIKVSKTSTLKIGNHCWEKLKKTRIRWEIYCASGLEDSSISKI